MKICGLDECGRGAFAGPLVAAAVIINSDLSSFESLLPAPLRDSKKLSASQREKIVSVLPQLSVTYLLAEISVEDINERGLGWANREIFERLIAKMKANLYIVDGNLNFRNPRVRTLIKGDDKCLPVMLASIIAKVHRDKLLTALHRANPGYQWDQNAGYGTAHHLSAIKANGLSPHHRLQFVQTYFHNHLALP